jgi:two-component SAPR family response regulator
MPDMNKRQLIEQIRQHNTTVAIEFLSQFDESALQQYLEHLEGANKRNLRIASYVRRTPRLRLVS